MTADIWLNKCCEVMHDAYEKAAVGAGWETNPASRKPWSEVPAANQATMRVAVQALLDGLAAEIEAAADVAEGVFIGGYGADGMRSAARIVRGKT